MALLECPDCTGKVSSTASACPHCGWTERAVIERRPITGVTALLVALAYPFLIVALMYAFPQWYLLVVVAGVVGAVVAVKRRMLRA